MTGTTMKTTNFFLNNEHLSETGIALYVDALKLDRVRDLPVTILQHVEQCDECKMQVMQVAEIMKEEGIDKRMKHPYFDAEKEISSPFSIMYRIAAVLVFAAFAGTMYYVLTDSSQDEGTEITKQKQQNSIPADSITPEKKQTLSKPPTDLIAATFEPSPNMEDLVLNEFRSTMMEVVSPKNGIVVPQPVVLQWKNSGKKITVRVLNNKEVTIASATMHGDRFIVKKKIAPGLYYWKLETDSELLFVGKFLVKK